MSHLLFCSSELAARIEHSEQDLIGDVTASVGRRRGTDVLLLPLSGGLAAWSRPDHPCNKVVGLGFEGLDVETLEQYERYVAERNRSVQVELPSHAGHGIGEDLGARGYRLVGFEDVLGRTLENLEPVVEGSVEIREVDEGGEDDWLRTLVRGFAVPDTQGNATHEEFPEDELTEALSDMATASGVLRTIALRSGEVAGAGTLRIRGGIATFCGTSTLPEHRRRGVQTAMLRARLRVARERGCDLAVVTTLPGSKSQQNVVRQGFGLLYNRAVLQLPPPA